MTTGKSCCVRVRELGDLATLAHGMSQAGGTVYFRGQANSIWHMTSSLERAADAAGCHSFLRIQRENEALFECKRDAHLYLGAHVPRVNEDLEWWSLMQHFGAPTRLVDFTTSLHIATYFAVSDATSTCAVWLVNSSRIPEANSRLRLSKQPKADVLALRPRFGNERLRAQRGLFLFSRDLLTPFADSLRNSLGILGPPGGSLAGGAGPVSVGSLANPTQYVLLKCEIERVDASRMLRDLDQIPVNASTVYPGMEGLCRSLKMCFQP